MNGRVVAAETLDPRTSFNLKSGSMHQPLVIQLREVKPGNRV
jgi:hypothetical protein